MSKTCPKCLKCVILEKLRKLRSSAFRKFGTRLAYGKIGIRADPDSSRHDLGVAIASVALPKRECGRSLKPRKKRGMWECAQWSKGRGRLVGGHGWVSQRSWGVWSQGTPRHRKVKKVENLSRLGGVLRTDAKTSYGKRVGVPAKLGGCA
jgi:hypothetical protein